MFGDYVNDPEVKDIINNITDHCYLRLKKKDAEEAKEMRPYLLLFHDSNYQDSSKPLAKIDNWGDASLWGVQLSSNYKKGYQMDTDDK